MPKGDLVLLQKDNPWLKDLVSAYVAWAAAMDSSKHNMLPIIIQGTTRFSATNFSVTRSSHAKSGAVPIIPPLADDFIDVLWRLWLRIPNRCDI